MKRIKTTVNHFATEALGIKLTKENRPLVAAFLNALVELTGDARKLEEKIPNVTEIEPGVFVKAQGKGQTVYVIPTEITFKFPDSFTDVKTPQLSKVEKVVSYRTIPVTLDDGVDSVETANEPQLVGAEA